VQAAARLGISHSEFLGWPAHDRNIMIALGRVERNTGRYGEWLPDATSERADATYYQDDAIRYVPHGPFTNWAEKAAQDAQKVYKKAEGEDANLNGMFWTVEQV
jgi:hypothetical protein